MRLDLRIVPRVDMAYLAAVVGHVPGRAQEDTARVHEFAEGEVDQQGADQKHMGKEDGADLAVNGRREGDEAGQQLLDGDDIHPQKEPHRDAGKGNAQDQKEWEIVIGQRDVANLPVDQAAEKQKKNGQWKDEIGLVKPRHPDLQQAVPCLQGADESRESGW